MQAWRTFGVIAVAAWLLGACWAISSPVGSSPDDNFHLTSIYCETGDEELCRDLDGAGPSKLVEVPSGVLAMNCYVFNPQASGECSEDAFNGVAKNDHYNHRGDYPPTFYWTLGRFAGADVETSVIVMRLVALTVALACFGLAAWASPVLRDSQLVAWSVTSIPLGMFLFASTNPSGWGIAGVAAMWPAGYALLHADGRRELVLATAAAAFAAVLATSRGDTAGITAGILGLVIIVYARSRLQLIAVGMAVVLIFVLGAALLRSGQSGSLDAGLGGAEVASGLPLFWNNAIKLPELWAGSMGVNWGLGWLDTIMPALVWLPAVILVSALTFQGIAKLGSNRGFILAAVLAVMIVYPLLILQRSDAVVGTQFQPRYVLPVLFVFVGIALAPIDGWAIRLSPPQRWTLTVLAIVATSIALHVQLRRYVTGTDVVSPNLNIAKEWSYGTLIDPMGVWVIGSLAAIALFIPTLRLLAVRRDSVSSDADTYTPPRTQ